MLVHEDQCLLACLVRDVKRKIVEKRSVYILKMYLFYEEELS